MKEFFYNILSSSSLVNAATFLSLFLTILPFYFQLKKGKEERKEILRLKDEIVNLIIRNHVNSGVKIYKINMDSLIEGFEKVKNNKLHLTKTDLVKMIYARVYENEHIANTTRLELLKQLEEMLNNYTYELQDSSSDSKNENKLFPITLYMLLLIILLLYSLLFIVDNYIVEFNTIFINVIIIFIPILSFLLVKPILNKLENKIINKKRVPANFGQNNNVNFSTNITHQNNSNLPEIKFEDYFQNSKDIREALENRVLIETMLRRIYSSYFNENTKSPVLKIISILTDEGIISEENAPAIKEVFRASNYLIHEGKLPKDLSKCDDLIRLMKNVIMYLNSVLNNIQEKTN